MNKMNPIEALVEVELLGGQLRMEDCTGAVFLPLVFPQGIHRILCVNVWPQARQIRLQLFHLIRIECPRSIAERRPFGSRSCRPVSWIGTFGSHFAIQVNLPDSVNGPAMFVGQNARVSWSRLLPLEARGDRPLNGEHDRIPRFRLGSFHVKHSVGGKSM